MTPVRTCIRFTGRVQGVGFRATARAVAAGYRVTGWVRNEADGSVVMEVQGEASEVERCLTALGERMAGNIHGADRTTVAPLERELRFEVRR